MPRDHSDYRATLSLLILCSSLALCSPTAFGQAASTGAILGTVTNAAGETVPDAEVTVTHTTTQRSLSVKTTDAGFYTFEGLVAGFYDVSIRKTGFKTHTAEGVKVDPGQRLGLSLTLAVGEITEQVSITANEVKIETESGESAGVITSEQVNDLLINGRNFLGLALLVPGVNSGAITGRSVGGGSLNAGGLTGETPISINGLGREYSSYTVDGAYNMNTGNNININVTSPLDTISEFRILKDNYSAKYGVAGSAQIMVESKSGTQAFHGTVYEFLRNDALDANNFFSAYDPETGKKIRTPLKQNNFGFSISGPLFIPKVYNTDKKKTFFFVNEEWRIRRSGSTLRGAMIPEAMRNGDFTSSPTRPDTGLVFDSVATDILARRNPGVNCLPAPNRLNPACFDQNAVKLMNRFWPLPNNPSGGFLNYINPGVNKVDNRNDTYRVDHYFSERFTLMGRFMYETVTDSPPALTWGPNPAPTTSQTIKTTGVNTLIRFTANITPKMINQTSIVQTHTKPRLRWTDAELPADVNLNLPFPNADPHGNIPTINMARGWAGLGVSSLPVDASDGEITLSDDFSVTKGSHVLQAGAMYIWGVKRQNLFSTAEGQYLFSGIHTGDPVGDFLLGLNASYFQTSGERRGYFFYNQLETYFQDDWKVNPRLTLNLGLRYVYFSPDTLEDDNYTDFDPQRWDSARAPVVLPDGTFRVNSSGQPVTAAGQPADLLNGAVFAGQGDVPRGIFKAWKRGFAPRLGFAWDVFGDGKGALRGGYGIGYSRIPFGNYASLNNPPFINSVTLLNGTLTNPAIGVADAITPTGMNMIGPPNQTYRPTMIQTWSLTAERELFQNSVLSVAYVGSGSRHVRGGLDFNYPLRAAGPSINDPACLQPGQTVPAGGFDFDPCLNRGRVSANFTRPFTGWGALSNSGAGSYFGTSNYHSLQVGFRYRPGKALSFDAAYTWGKVLTDVADRGFDGRNTGTGAQNPRNFKAEYGSPGWDRRHIFTAGYIYDLPFLRGRTDALGTIFGNWTFSGITVIQSGFVFAPGMATGTNGLASRPNLVGKVSGPQTIEKWFNTDAFVAPAFGFFGNAGTGLIQGPGEQTWNWALFKTFPIKERARLQFRAEFFNIWNHANFDAVSTGFGAANFGQITRAMEPRILEFGLRFEF